MCVCVRTYHSMPVEIKQQPGQFSYPVCPRGSNPGVSLGTKCLCPLNHLISSFISPYGGHINKWGGGENWAISRVSKHAVNKTKLKFKGGAIGAFLIVLKGLRQLKKFFLTFIYCICMYLWRFEDNLQVSIIFPLWGFWRLNSEAPLPAKLSSSPSLDSEHTAHTLYCVCYHTMKHKWTLLWYLGSDLRFSCVMKCRAFFF